nr:histidinol-phosphate transaminase [Actinomycetales bacterium]
MLARKDARAAEKGARTAQREAKHASKAAEVAAKASRQYGAAPAVVNPTPAEPPTRRTGKPRLRPAVAALPAYVPGARGDGRPMWKLSSNENPNPPLTGLLAALSDQLAEVNRYPDMYATELTEALAGRLGVAREQVVTGNGSVAVLAHVLTALVQEGDEVIYPWRSFEAYPIAVGSSGAASVRVPLTADGRHDLGALAAAVTPQTKVVILCSPNNPTGPSLTEEELREFLAAVPSDVAVVLDEAYREYVDEAKAVDGVDLLPAFPNLLLLRTFSKAYGLAGLRVGYAVGAPKLVAGIRACSTAFGTNTLAQHAALAVLKREDEVRERVAATVAERQRVLAGVRAQGWDVPAADGNFFWLATGEATGRLVADAADAGLLLRGFAGEGVRITIGETDANDAVIEFLGDWRR